MYLSLFNMIVIMGIGNSSRGDDGVGLLVARLLEKRAEIILCDTDPLDYVEKICDEKPELLIILDAIDAGRKAGEIIQVNENMLENLSVSTHHFPISLFLKFIEKCVKRVEIWGIQVKNVSFGEEISGEVKSAASKLAELINNRINEKV